MVDGFVAMMNSEHGLTAPVNMGNPGDFTMLELAETVLRLLGGKSKISFNPLPMDDLKQRRPDISLVQGKISWKPQVVLDGCLKETVSYFRNILDV